MIWKKRQAFAVIQDKVVKTIVEMDFMSEEAARNWCKSAKGNYDLSIEKFVSLVQEYCAKKVSSRRDAYKQFIIQCSFGSYAEEYCRKNKIKYQLV